MNIKQRDKLIGLIRKDCRIRYKYIDDCGNTCAIGQIALASGVSKKTLRNTPGQRISSSYLKDIQKSILLKFGLSYWELQRIQNINDDEAFKLRTRRKVIVAYLNDIPLTD